MWLVHKTDRYAFFVGISDDRFFYDITPVTQGKFNFPDSGYFSREYIEKIKGVTFPKEIVEALNNGVDDVVLKNLAI